MQSSGIVSTFLSFWENKHSSTWVAFPAIYMKGRTTRERGWSELIQTSSINNWEVPVRTYELTVKNLALRCQQLLYVCSTQALLVGLCASQALVSLRNWTVPKPIFRNDVPRSQLWKKEAEALVVMAVTLAAEVASKCPFRLGRAGISFGANFCLTCPASNPHPLLNLPSHWLRSPVQPPYLVAFPKVLIVWTHALK